MKILPDYLIQYMPLIEEAMEELRLSVIDHAYDLLKCLDIDELSSDVIRKKLELYHIKLDNMPSYWLPNGRFYRVYPLIKHNRTRYNAIQSIVKSGGQFEGLWSDEFSNKKELDYRDIQLLRHYQMKSNLDGYFFVSGDASRNPDGTIKSSVVTALATDALLEQSLPAGYTYLYMPWPRPLYPTDSDYFYNVHSLQYDRLHYAINCNDPNKSYYDLSVPASSYYYNVETRRQSPYWYDYHYITSSSNPYKSYWPIEKFRWDYYNSDGDLIAYIKVSLRDSQYNYEVYRVIADLDIYAVELVTENEDIASIIDSAVRCELFTSIDSSVYPPEDYSECAVLDSSNSYFITRCILHILSSCSAPNRYQNFLPEESVYNIKITKYDKSKYDSVVEALSSVLNICENKSDIDYILNEIDTNESYILSCSSYYSAKYVKDKLEENNLFTVDEIEDGKIVRSIDECFTENDHIPIYMFGPYRYDYLAPKYSLHVYENRGHFKTYKPLWDAASTIFGISQSSFKTSLDGYSNESMINIFKLKQDENIPKIDNNKIYGESFVRYNEPPVSKETFTSYDRPVYGRLDPIYTAFFRSSDDSQGSNTSLNDSTNQNKIYEYNSQSPVTYDPKLYYTVVSVGSKLITDGQDIINNASLYIEGDPVTNNLYINKNSQSGEYNEITYKTSLVHKLWFRQDKSDTTLSNTSEELDKLLYNRLGSTECLYYSNNSVDVSYNVLGVYSSNGRLITKESVSLNCAISRDSTLGDKYIVYYNTNSSNIRASYVLFTVDVTPGSVPVIELQRVQVYRQSSHENTTTGATYKPSAGVVKIDGTSEFITMQEFYDEGYIIAEQSVTRYYGNQELSLYCDDNALT